jgi:hypothetical protein
MASKTVLVWRCKECDKECLRIREESRCMCGHRFKEHGRAGHKCSNGNCKCAGFFYIIAEGAWILRCRCKHKHIEHDCTTLQHKCLKAGCKGCTGFDSPFVCNCDHQWSSHEQVAVTITPSLEAMAAFSEVCGGGGGVQRGGIDLSLMPIALTGAPPHAALQQHAQPASTCSPAGPHAEPASSCAAIGPSSAAAVQTGTTAAARQPLALAPSRSANSYSSGAGGGGDAAAAASIGKSSATVSAAQASAAPSRIPSYGFSRVPSFGR